MDSVHGLTDNYFPAGKKLRPLHVSVTGASKIEKITFTGNIVIDRSKGITTPEKNTEMQVSM